MGNSPSKTTWDFGAIAKQLNELSKDIDAELQQLHDEGYTLPDESDSEAEKNERDAYKVAQTLPNELSQLAQRLQVGNLNQQAMASIFTQLKGWKASLDKSPKFKGEKTKTHVADLQKLL